MPRIFNDTEVYDDTVAGTDSSYNDPESNEVLGRADKLSVQFTVTQPDGTGPVLTAKLQTSNDGRHYHDHTTLLDAVDISSPPYRALVESGAAMLGAFARIKLTLGGTNPAARVRIAVCGRTMG